MKKGFRFSRDQLLIILSTAFLCFFFYMLCTMNMSRIQFDTPINFSTGWEKKADEANCTLLLSRTVTPDMEGKSVNFYAYDAYITALLDGEQIYHYGEPVKFCKSPSSFQHFISIPIGSSGQELEILIETVYPNKFTENYDIMLGSISGVSVDLLKTELGDIIVNIIIFVLGVALVILFFSQLSRKIVDKGALFLGLMSILFVIGSNCDLFFFQLLLPNGVAQYFLYYFSIYMLPLLVIRYLESLSEGLKGRPIFFTHTAIITVLTILQFLGAAEMTETLVIYCIISGVELLCVGVMLARVGIDGSNSMRHAFLVLIASVVITLCLNIFNPVKGTTLLIIKLGLCFYLGVAIHNYINRLVIRLAEARNAEILRHQAYTDHLTELGNRFALAEKMKEADVQSLAIVSFDINNLKYYNDLRGHACGDNLILKAAKIMSEVYSDVYRVGGDEFVAVLSNKTEEELADMRNRLCELAKEASEENLLIEIACGYSRARAHDQDYEDILKRADAAMYRHKLELKRNSIIQSVR